MENDNPNIVVQVTPSEEILQPYLLTKNPSDDS